MDYTTLALVHQSLQSTETGDDPRISVKITEASRVIDQTLLFAPPNYYELDDIVLEPLRGIIGKAGEINCWPGKFTVNSITYFQYRATPIDNWISVDPARIAIDGRQLKAYDDLLTRGKVYVQVSYRGGVATETFVGPVGTINNLPQYVTDAATLLTIRMLREEETGVSDVVGVAALTGEVVYTKALPQRVIEMLRQDKRRIV